MSEQQYRVVADRDKGDDLRGYLGMTQVGDHVVMELEPEPDYKLVPIRIERPVPTTDEPPVTDTSSGEHRRVIQHVGDDLPICDTCINVLGLNVRWDHAVLRHERDGITPAEPQPSPHPPTREQIAEALHLSDESASYDPFDYDRGADAVLALFQNGATRD